jgi:prepilin signal peptidase PulO-like enzyme (type II secretory pathway)
MDELKTIINSRSHCPDCRKTIAWYDLIPFVSFVLLWGKCRNCGKKISWQYPLVELGVGSVFLILFLFFSFTPLFFLYALIFSLLTVVFVYDLRTQTVPEAFVWAALILSLGTFYFIKGQPAIPMLEGALLAGGFLALLVYTSKEKWMGAGDIKIGLILGLLAGFPGALLAMFFSFFSGSILGLIYLFATRGKVDKKGLKTSLPFAPFLILSSFLVITYGKIVVDWYFGLF